MFFMENPPRHLLDEIASLIGSVKSQLSLVEEKLAELSAYAEGHAQHALPENAVDGKNEVTIPAGDLFTGEPSADASVHIDAGDLLKEAEHLVYETGYVEKPDHTDRSSDQAHDHEPVMVSEPEKMPEPVQNQAEHLAVMDVLAEKEAWKKDRPGMPVKDVRSAISLNDRALFIRSLFREDPLLFSQTLARINSMASLDEVEETVRHEFPEWSMDSEVVYRFMMCVRRKVG